MNVSSLFFAQAATQLDKGRELLTTLPMFAIMGVMFYFVLIRPQQKRAKQQAAMLKTLKKGDKIVTSSGILGVVLTVKDGTVVLRSEETKLEVLKSTVAEVVQAAAGEVSQA